MPQSFADQLRSIPMSASLGQSLERAHRSARDQSHRLVTLEHLLLALTEDAEAALILQSANVDLARLGTDVSGYLGRLLEDMRAEPGDEPRPDPELLRVLQAAASAAQQSRRKQIDGAIVLAAIVGDGKSPAAGILKTLGMTFEEAIRALQRANTRARLKPLAKASQPRTGPADAPAEVPTPAAAHPNGASPASAGPAVAEAEAAPEAKPLVAQSADEILAAARARIMQRATTVPASPKPGSAREAAPQAPAAAGHPPLDVAPDIAPIDPVQTKSLTEAIEAAMAATSVRGKDRVPQAPTVPAVAAAARLDKIAANGDAGMAEPSAPSAERRPAWAPAPEPQRPAEKRPPQAAPGRVPPPFPARPVHPDEGPRRPPLPQRLANAANPPPPPPQAAFPNRPARAPWPERGEHGGRAHAVNGSPADMAAPGARPAPWPVPPARASGANERALLVENVPRRMRVGVPAVAEVHINSDKIDRLLAALNGRGDGHPAQAMSVRLTAPGDAFWIAPASAETHWIGGTAGAARPNPAAWRWTVVPRRRGRNRLILTVSVHTGEQDTADARALPPDRTIDVRVRANHLRRALRLAGWLVAAAAGAAMARHGQELWAPAAAIVRKALALLGG